MRIQFKKLPSVSIIIPTLNRLDSLKEGLLSLNKVDYPRKIFEVIVVANASPEKMIEMLKGIKKSLNYSFCYLKEKKAGPARARNLGIKKSKGEIIVFTDDDCMFEPGWLKKLIKPLEDPAIGCCGGEDRAYKKRNLFSICSDYAFSSFLGSGGIHGRPMPIKVGRFHPMTCNMASKKEYLVRAGLFDVNLYEGDETDLIYRLEKLGLETVPVDNAFVWHRTIDNLRGFIKKIYKRGKARVIMLQRYKMFSDFIYFLPALMVIFALFLLFFSLYKIIYLKIFIWLFAVYLFLLFLEGINSFLIHRKLLSIFIVPFLIFFQHAFHGIGFLSEMERVIFKKNDSA